VDRLQNDVNGNGENGDEMADLQMIRNQQAL